MEGIEKNHKCEDCNYTTQYKSNLEKHKKTGKHLSGLRKARKDKKENKCESCNKIFSSYQSLKNHKICKHINEENKKKECKYYCEYCGFGNDIEKLYKKHIENKKHIRLTEMIKKGYFNTV